MSAARILAVDDEPHVLELCRDVLEADGYHVELTAATSDALGRLQCGDYDLVLTDLKMPRRSGLELMHDARAAAVQVPFVILTGYPSIELAVDAVRQGAEDFLAKPFDNDQLGRVVRRVLARQSAGDKKPVHHAAPPRPASAAALEVLRRHVWPSDVRELRDTIERLVSLASGELMNGAVVPADGVAPATAIPGERTSTEAVDFRQAKRLMVDRFERQYVHDLLAVHGGNVTRSAHGSGMKRSAFQRLMRKHRLASRDYRRAATEGVRE